MNGTPVVAAELGRTPGMIGAATMALERGRRRALMAGRLTVCPTPIGNLEDLSPRARRALERRRPGRLRGHPPRRAASSSGSRSPRPRLVSNHEGNEAERAVQLAQQIERGARVVLISDAGTPGDLRSRLSG